MSRSLVIAGLIWIISAMATEAAQVDGWICKQSSSRYGPLTCWVTPRNFRMDALDLRLYVRPPFKDVTMYNMDNKLKYVINIDKLSRRIAIRSLSEDDIKDGTREEIKKEGKHTVSGLACEEYLSCHIKKNGQKKPKVQIYATRDLALPKAMELACAKLTDCPPDLGFPVRLQIYEAFTDAKSGIKSFRLQPMLNTHKADRASIDDKMFIEPDGFKQARDEMEVMIGD